MNELTQERSHIHASIVKDLLVTRHLARNMNEFTQERSRMHAGIVKCPLVSHQTAGNMKIDMLETAL